MSHRSSREKGHARRKRTRRRKGREGEKRTGGGGEGGGGGRGRGQRVRARTVSGRRGYMYASSTAGLFYFMNRNISRDNWTRGARPPLNCLHTAVCLPRVPHIVPGIRAHAPPPSPTTTASRRIALRPSCHQPHRWGWHTRVYSYNIKV